MDRQGRNYVIVMRFSYHTLHRDRRSPLWDAPIAPVPQTWLWLGGNYYPNAITGEEFRTPIPIGLEVGQALPEGREWGSTAGMDTDRQMAMSGDMSVVARARLEARRQLRQQSG